MPMLGSPGEHALQRTAHEHPAPLDFRILGTLEVLRAGRPVPIPSRQPRIVLAALLLNADNVISAERLIDYIWGERPPRTARTILQCYVSRLRKLLRDDRLPARPDDPQLLTRPPGYLLHTGAAGFDLARFDTSVGDADRLLSEGQAEAAAAMLRAALDLWRGPALADVCSETLQRVDLPPLEERRLAAIEKWVDLELDLGRHAALVPELEALVAANPLRERLSYQLMVALARTGQQGEALRVYQATRQEFVRELGLEPGHALQAMQQAVLTGDPSLRWRPAEPVMTRRRRPPARQLPPDIPSFTGRERLTDQIAERLTGVATSAAAVVTVVGGPGTGKTALAVHAAHLARDHFPDGQLFVDLRGTGASPLPPAGALGLLLEALGDGENPMPATVEELRVRYQAVLSGQRVLLLLDDVRDESQVRPLLPGTPGCAVVMTSRSRLDGLIGGEHLTLETLDAGEALELLTRVIGRDRVRAEPGAARRIVDACAGLPLALRIAAARLAARPAWPLSTLGDRLEDPRRRLSELRVGDLDLRHSFARSDRLLCAEERRAFRLLSHVLPGHDRGGALDTHAAARALGAAHEATFALLERLVDAHLLEVSGIDACGHPVYRYPNLLGLYAREPLDEEGRKEDGPP